MSPSPDLGKIRMGSNLACAASDEENGGLERWGMLSIVQICRISVDV